MVEHSPKILAREKKTYFKDLDRCFPPNAYYCMVDSLLADPRVGTKVYGPLLRVRTQRKVSFQNWSRVEYSFICLAYYHGLCLSISMPAFSVYAPFTSLVSLLQA